MLYARSKETTEKLADQLAQRTGSKVKAYQLDGQLTLHPLRAYS